MEPKPTHEHPPRVYLSMSEGMYRVIQQGIPISPDKTCAEDALRVAVHYRLEVSGWLWNGDRGEFELR